MLNYNNNRCLNWLNKSIFENFETKPIDHTKLTMEEYFTFSISSIDELNSFMTNWLNVCAIESSKTIDYGFMRQRTIEDFNGHNYFKFNKLNPFVDSEI